MITLNEPFGQYFAVLQVGTPAKEVAVIMDTGSELLWIQCQPCEKCGQQTRDPIFDPSKSSSYKSLACVDALNGICSISGDDSVETGCNDAGACLYTVTYGDSSNSTGYLSTETLTIPTAKGSSFQLLEFVFGCGVNNDGIEAQLNASGLMGLDRGNFSVISQLGVDTFAYCLPNRVKSVDVSGYLTFGKSSNNKPLKYTPMVQNLNSSFLSQFYYLNMTGVSVNGKLLDIASSAFEIDAVTGNGGTVIDSGTTLTTFVDEAYTIIVQAFESSVDSSLTKADLGENSTMLCYQVPLTQKEAPTAPKVTLHFVGSLDIELDTDHLFRNAASDTTYNYYCMAFDNSGTLASGAKNFIGNYQQQNFLVEYDIGNSRIGFAPTQCSSSNHSLKTLAWFPVLLSSMLLLFIPLF